jgi:hypothetical protein
LGFSSNVQTAYKSSSPALQQEKSEQVGN